MDRWILLWEDIEPLSICPGLVMLDQMADLLLVVFFFFDKPSWLFLEWLHQFALPTPLPVFAVISYLGDCHSNWVALVGSWNALPFLPLWSVRRNLLSRELFSSYRKFLFCDSQGFLAVMCQAVDFFGFILFRASNLQVYSFTLLGTFSVRISFNTLQTLHTFCLSIEHR